MRAEIDTNDVVSWDRNHRRIDLTPQFRQVE